VYLICGCNHGTIKVFQGDLVQVSAISIEAEVLAHNQISSAAPPAEGPFRCTNIQYMCVRTYTVYICVCVYDCQSLMTVFALIVVTCREGGEGRVSRTARQRRQREALLCSELE
jgi:hypothetical protein